MALAYAWRCSAPPRDPLAGLLARNQFARVAYRRRSRSVTACMPQQRMNGGDIIRRHGDLDQRRYLLQGFARSHANLYASISTPLTNHSARSLSRPERA